MSQVLMCFDWETQTVDFGVDDNGFISLEGGLETAVLYSLLTNRRAPQSNTEHAAQPYGWWGDSYPEADGDLWGSHLWLEIGRSTLTTRDMRRAQVAGESCLKWLLDDGLAKNVQVTPERIDPDTVKMRVGITQPDGEPWSNIWEIHRNGI